MEKVILEEICKNLKWYDKIIVRIFSNIFVKTYHKTRTDIVNGLLK